MSLRHERRLMIDALSRPGEIVAWPAADLDLVLRVLRRARLLGRLAEGLAERGLLDALPLPARDALASARIAAQARARVAAWELDRIACALEGLADLQVVAMKGCAYLLAGLPHARGRMFADVDLLVPEARLREVEECLLAQGWQAAALSPYDERYYREWTHELPPLTHAEREVEVDLHHNVQMRTSRLRPDAARLLAAARPAAITENPGAGFRSFRLSRFAVLAPIDMTLHAMTHLLYGGEMDDALRELVDIDALLRHHAGHEPDFWAKFWPRAEQLDLARPAFYGLRYANRLLGTAVPDAVLAASRAGAPNAAVVAAMDRLVPEALFPPHPGQRRRWTTLARLLLYVRAHWVRMPPWMLVRHLAYKAYVRREHE
ncbi:MAG: nucleotidyltransferase family protein [Steroidobacteraceae bacterium]